MHGEGLAIPLVGLGDESVVRTDHLGVADDLVNTLQTTTACQGRRKDHHSASSHLAYN